METSAKTNTNVEDVFRQLARAMLEIYNPKLVSVSIGIQNKNKATGACSKRTSKGPEAVPRSRLQSGVASSHLMHSNLIFNAFYGMVLIFYAYVAAAFVPDV